MSSVRTRSQRASAASARSDDHDNDNIDDSQSIEVTGGTREPRSASASSLDELAAAQAELEEQQLLEVVQRTAGDSRPAGVVPLLRRAVEQKVAAKPHAKATAKAAAKAAAKPRAARPVLRPAPIGGPAEDEDGEGDEDYDPRGDAQAEEDDIIDVDDVLSQFANANGAERWLAIYGTELTARNRHEAQVLSNH